MDGRKVPRGSSCVFRAPDGRGGWPISISSPSVRTPGRWPCGARSCGLGGWLLDELLAIADGQGSESVFLEVRSRDDVAQSLYLGRGFKIVGGRKNYYHDDDAVVMRRDRPAHWRIARSSVAPTEPG